MMAAQGGGTADHRPTPDHLAATHSASGIGPRAWSAVEFAELLAEPSVRLTGDDRAFALGRVVLDEAEVLTLATHPDHRRQGLAGAALMALTAAMAASGARRVFLEVAADNGPALALYQKAGFAAVGRRRGYYGQVDGLVMERTCGESAAPGTVPAGPDPGEEPPV